MKHVASLVQSEATVDVQDFPTVAELVSSLVEVNERPFKTVGGVLEAGAARPYLAQPGQGDPASAGNAVGTDDPTHGVPDGEHVLQRVSPAGHRRPQLGQAVSQALAF